MFFSSCELVVSWQTPRGRWECRQQTCKETKNASTTRRKKTFQVEKSRTQASDGQRERETQNEGPDQSPASCQKILASICGSCWTDPDQDWDPSPHHRLHLVLVCSAGTWSRDLQSWNNTTKLLTRYIRQTSERNLVSGWTTRTVSRQHPVLFNIHPLYGFNTTDGGKLSFDIIQRRCTVLYGKDAFIDIKHLSGLKILHFCFFCA